MRCVWRVATEQLALEYGWVDRGAHRLSACLVVVRTHVLRDLARFREWASDPDPAARADKTVGRILESQTTATVGAAHRLDWRRLFCALAHVSTIRPFSASCQVRVG